MTRRFPSLLVAAVAGLACLAGTALAADPAPKADAANYIPNPSFEQARGRNPAAWRTQKWGGDGVMEYAPTGKTGKRSVLLRSDQGGDISWTTTVAVEPRATYRLSGWIKTENVAAQEGAKGALLNLHNLQPTATKALTGTNDWTRVEVVFQTEDHDAVQVNCLLGGWGMATGTAWFDDLALQLVSKSAAAQPTITIDAAKIREPISKYVYGQFIEHLGRCIYGGIWAEMLEDRKFYYPVGAKESPWKAIGGNEAVKMVKENAFVGQHTPQVTLAGDQPRGIAQSGLGLVEGKDYVGYLWLRLHETEEAVVKATLIWGDGPQHRQVITPDYLIKMNGSLRLSGNGSYDDNRPNDPSNASPRNNAKVSSIGLSKAQLKFTAGATTDNARLEITATGKGTVAIGTVSLMPADNVHGMRADTLALLKELDSPVYRWPGGNFVSGYNWKDGIGDRDRRPSRKNPAWTGVEHNDMGIDEFMTFCRLLKTEPYIAVNSGLGGVQEAVEELQYANAAADTPMGQLRAKNGHAEPYGVKYWGIGNEMYGGWQLGHMTQEKYVKKHNEFAEAMRKADPSIKLVAVGDVGRWSEGMMKHCADHMDLISEHFYCQERPGLFAHVKQIPDATRHKAEGHRRYREQFDSLKGKDIRIALDEWNYWYGPHVFGELGTRYFLKDGLGIAAGLNEMARQSDMIFMANYAQTVNVIGCIKTSKTAAELETTGLVLKLYRHHFGTLPVATESSRPLEVQAAWSADRKTLTVAVVNASLEAMEIPMTVKGAKLTGTGTKWQIAGNDPMVYNDPGQPPKVKIEESKVQGIGEKLCVAPCSVTLFALDAEAAP